MSSKASNCDYADLPITAADLPGNATLFCTSIEPRRPVKDVVRPGESRACGEIETGPDAPGSTPPRRPNATGCSSSFSARDAAGEALPKPGEALPKSRHALGEPREPLHEPR